MQKERWQDSDRLLDAKVVWEHFLRRWYLIVAVFLASLIVMYIGTKLFVTPKYSSTAKLYIFNTENENISTSEISISTYLARDYAELIVDRTVLNEVIDNLDLNYSYSGLKNCVNVYPVENTRILCVTVTTKDAKLSQSIANDICRVSKEKMVELMGISRVNIISEAYLPSAPVQSDLRIAFNYGMIIGAAISVILLLYFILTDDKIKGSDDVEKYLGISVLATIPYSQPRTKTAPVASRSSAR